MTAAVRAASRTPETIRAVVEDFLKGAREPALLEPGEELFPLTRDNFTLEMRGSRLTLDAWDRTRNLTRRLVAAELTSGRVQLTIERFARREATIYLVDLARRSGADFSRRGERLVFRERFRLLLRRQFPEWHLAELSAEANLEYSLSPSFPRAYLRHGRHGWAAIACPPGADAAAVLTFGLIWLSHLRARERRMAIEGLAIYVPAGEERATALRLLCLDPAAARFALFTYTPQDHIAAIDPEDRGNIDAGLEPCRRPAPDRDRRWQSIAALPGVESIPRHDGRISLRVRGVEFATLEEGALHFGLGERRPASESHIAEIRTLVEEIGHARSPAARDREHPLYRHYPEAWLESQARAQIQTIDAALLPRAGLWPGPRFRRGRARHSRPARGRLHRPSRRGGTQGVRRFASTLAGARLLDSRRVASQPRRFRVPWLFSGN